MTRAECASTLLLLFSAALSLEAQDAVQLKNGQLLSGVVREFPDRIQVASDFGTVTIARAQVETVHRGSSARDEFLRRRSGAGNDATAQLDLADWCRSVGLADEADRLYRAVLAQLAGEEPRSPGWIPVRARPELPTGGSITASEHFRLHHSAEFRDAESALADLETMFAEFVRTYTEWYGALRSAGPWTIVLEEDAARFAERFGKGWAGKAFVRHECAFVLRQSSLPQTLGILRHEAAHLLFESILADPPAWAKETAIYHEAEYERSRPDRLAWLEEGFACDWQHSQALPPARGVTGGPDRQRWAEIQVRLGIGEPLESLVGMADHEFYRGGPGERYAQAWSLVRFLREAHGGKYREGWVRFLDQARRGRSGVALFRACFGVRPSALESEWSEWVKSFEVAPLVVRRSVDRSAEAEPRRTGWESGCHFDLALGEPDAIRAHARLDELVLAAAAGTRSDRAHAVGSLLSAFPTCRRREILRLFEAEPDPEIACTFVYYLVWARAAETLVRLRHWRAALRLHAEDPVSPCRIQFPRHQWLIFAVACDAFGDHSETEKLLAAIRRNYVEGEIQCDLVTRLTDRRVVPFLGKLLVGTWEGELPNRSSRMASVGLRVLTSEEALRVARGETPSAEAWIAWVRENEPWLEWVAEPEVRLSRDGLHRLGYWRVNEEAKAAGKRAPAGEPEER